MAIDVAVGTVPAVVKSDLRTAGTLVLLASGAVVFWFLPIGMASAGAARRSRSACS